MKKFILLLLVIVIFSPIARAEDAATEERLTKLTSQIEELQAASVQTQKRIADLAKDIEELRQGQGKAGANYATQDDIKKLAATLQEIDEKRVEDNNKIVTEIEKLAKIGATEKKKPAVDTSTPAISDKGYEYVIQNGDTLSTIVAAYREKNIKVTVDSILKANPGLKASSLQVGKKIFIPAPQ